MNKLGKHFVPNIKINLIWLVLPFFFSACAKPAGKEKKPVAEVYGKILYAEDIPQGIYKGKDSVKEVNKYINNWIRINVISHFAEQNVDTAEINRLTLAYKQDLLKENYEAKLKTKLRDRIKVAEEELKKYYDLHKQNFPSKDTLLKWEFLILDAQDKQRYKIRQAFFSNKAADKDRLEQYFTHFLAYKLDTTGWIKYEKAVQIIPPFKKIRPVQGNFSRSEKNKLYLVRILKVIKPGQTLPYEYIKNDIKKFVTEQKTRKHLRHTYNQMIEEAYKNHKIKVYRP